MLENKVIAITGGIGKIGKIFCRSIVNNGGKVIIGDLNEKECIQLVNDLGKDKACFFIGDLTNNNNIDSFIKEGVNRFKHIDAAIQCAYPKSLEWGTHFEDLNAEYLSKDLFNQLGGAILFSQRIILYFKNRGHGNLIHLSSIQGISAPKFDHYEDTNMISPIEYSAIKSGKPFLFRS